MTTEISGKHREELPRYAVRLSPAEALEQLTHVRRGQSPREALEAAITWRDVLTPRLLDEIALAPVDVEARHADDTETSAYFLHTFAFHLLALFREPQAFPLMLDYFASDADLAEELSGDLIGAYLPAMLVRCYDGSGTRQLRLMIETDAYETLFRYECLKAYHGLAIAGHVEKSEVVGFVGDLLDAIPADAEPNSWYGWLALAAAELQAPELRQRIDALFDRGLTQSNDSIFGIGVVDKADVEEIYADRPQKLAAAILSDSFFESFVDRVCRWYWFQKPRPPERDAAARSYDAVAYDLPYVRTEAKVGRNDPCPCGSGQKYKKCCLH